MTARGNDAMNRWTLMAFATLLLGLLGAYLNLRASEVPFESAMTPTLQQTAFTLADPPTPMASPATDVVPPVFADASQAAAPASDAGSGAYDDGSVYQHSGNPERFPSTPQGVLSAFEGARGATSRCLDEARSTNPTLTTLLTLDVRIASQGDGSAAIEELRLPTSNDPALAFRGCLVSALVDQRFDVPEGGFVRLTLPVELSQKAP